MNSKRSHTAETAFAEIVQRFGTDILLHGDRLLGCFADIAPELHREKHLLQVLLDLRGNIVLMDTHKGPKGLQVSHVRKLIERMKDEYAVTEEGAKELCLAIWHALGNRNDPVEQMLLPPGQKPAPTPPKQTPPSRKPAPKPVRRTKPPVVNPAPPPAPNPVNPATPPVSWPVTTPTNPPVSQPAGNPAATTTTSGTPQNPNPPASNPATPSWPPGSIPVSTPKKRKRRRNSGCLGGLLDFLPGVLFVLICLWILWDILPFGRTETPQETTQPTQSQQEDTLPTQSQQEAPTIAGEMPPWQEPDSSYEKQTIDYGNGSYVELFFDEKGQERVRICYDGGGNVLYRFTADYLSNGRLCRQMCYDAEGEILMRIEWGYPDYEQLTTIVYTRGDGTLCRVIDYEYDENGNVVTVTAFTGIQFLISRRDYIYGEYGALQEVVTSYPDGSSDYSQYNTNGLIMQEKQFDTQGNMTHNRLYAYDGRGRMISASDFSAEGISEGRTEYTWNEDGTMTSSAVYSAGGTLLYTTEYDYDDQGNAQGETVTYADGEVCHVTAMTDIRGNMVYRHSTSRGGSGGYRIYDSLGNLTREVHWTPDSNYADSVDYHYDAYGYLAGRLALDCNSDGSFVASAYDADDNILAEYHYDSDGKVQYYYEYIYKDGQLEDIIRHDP